MLKAGHRRSAEMRKLRKADHTRHHQLIQTLTALIDQVVATAMAEVEASRVRNGYNSYGSGPRPAQAVHECSYSEFLKYKPLDFKGTEGFSDSLDGLRK
ncbi:hypothetical protein Tco_0107016 [Tanacetum coccineum]